MAKSLHYVTLDVFTSKRFTGNPLAVVFLPSPDAITDQQKLNIASEFNYSETIFVHPADPQQKQPRRIDIYLTDKEIPFAGHPTIGAASWLLLHSRAGLTDQGEPENKIVTKAGEIPISISSDNPNKVSAFVPHNVRIHSTRLPAAEVLKRFPGLQPHLDAKDHENGFPIVSIVKGMTGAHIRLPSLEALAAVAAGGPMIPTSEVADGGYLDAGWGTNSGIMMYFHVRDVWDEQLGAKVIRTRGVLGTLEDPATGSAASGLSSYLSLTEPDIVAKRGGEFRIVQGVEMGKRSEIDIKVALKAGEEKLESVQLQGSAVKVMEGDVLVADE